jgi:hypothetical protein
MKKPSKEDIIGGVQFFITLYTMVVGFWHTYLWIWYKLGLPLEWWSICGAMLLALLSMFGFYRWVANE